MKAVILLLFFLRILDFSFIEKVFECQVILFY